MTKQEILRLTAARRHSASGTGRLIRQRAGLSMREVADAVGTTEPTLSRWETGRRQPRSTQAAIRWAELLAALDGETASAA